MGSHCAKVCSASCLSSMRRAMRSASEYLCTCRRQQRGGEKGFARGEGMCTACLSKAASWVHYALLPQASVCYVRLRFPGTQKSSACPPSMPSGCLQAASQPLQTTPEPRISNLTSPHSSLPLLHHRSGASQLSHFPTPLSL